MMVLYNPIYRPVINERRNKALFICFVEVNFASKSGSTAST